ncbi:glycosyltransferase family 4 protein [Humidisolicoccus flavus]|uniref:glycosyltransferase family 4 protein n=1 Tax=Humidisolicoccus flavus TaxID=3111414 RepID=UPI00324E3A7E
MTTLERVAIVTESFLPTLNGVTTSVCRVLDHLIDRGIEAIVITPRCGAPMQYRGAPVYEVPSFSYRDFPVGLPNQAVQSLLQRFQPDIVHVASPFLLGANAISVAKRLGIPSVAIYQTDVAAYAQRNHLGLAKPAVWALLRSIHNGADRTLAPSSAALEDLATAGVQRTHLWRRGVDLGAFHPDRKFQDRTAALRSAAAPTGTVVVGYVGRLAPEKSLHNLALLEGIKNIKVVIVGDGPARPSLQQSLKKLDPLWLGALEGDELSTAYASFDVFVHTGEEETFGQTLQEAAASGLPVIAPAKGGPLDLVTHGITGFLYDPNTLRSLTASVSALVRSRELRARMGEAGRRAVLQRSWDVVAGELLEHYAAVLDERSTRQISSVPA